MQIILTFIHYTEKEFKNFFSPQPPPKRNMLRKWMLLGLTMFDSVSEAMFVYFS